MREALLEKLYKEAFAELTQNILPFWKVKMKDEERGGYFGRMTGDNQLVKDAPKGGILNARILWTFASAALHLESEEYLTEARRSMEYILEHFFDSEQGGTHWALHSDGTPAETKKQVYSQAFFIYALAEYFRASGDKAALSKAIELFLLIEEHSFDSDKNGYLEAFSRDWVLLEDLRLSDKDANEKKTMNTHLHVLEAYTNLYRVWKDQRLESALKNLIELFLHRIINKETWHLDLFFDEDWTRKSTLHSYGHDIEASWLLKEAAQVLGNKEVSRDIDSVFLHMVDAASEGLQDNGGMINEKNWLTMEVDAGFDWWPQAEAVVGFLNAYQYSVKKEYLYKALQSWSFIESELVDKDHGEWYWGLSPDGTPDRTNDKAGFWKCPYHNGRMCLEIIDRVKQFA